MQANGKDFLRITGILMIIGGGLDTLLNLVALVLVPTALPLIIPVGTATLVCIFGLFLGAFEAFTGICGIKYCGDTSRAKDCMMLGVIACAIALGNVVLSIANDSFGLTTILGIGLPALYLIGACMNMRPRTEE